MRIISKAIKLMPVQRPPVGPGLSCIENYVVHISLVCQFVRNNDSVVY